MDQHKSELSVIEREFQHVLESSRYGKLYQLLSVHGKKAICARCHMRKGELKRDPNERITIEINSQSKLNMSRGDFAFIDNGPNPVWSLYKVKVKDGDK